MDSIDTACVGSVTIAVMADALKETESLNPRPRQAAAFVAKARALGRSTAHALMGAIGR